jgi:hypothetical protein
MIEITQKADVHWVGEFPRLDQIIVKPSIVEHAGSPGDKKSGDQIVEETKPLVSSFIKTTVYNSFIPLIEFGKKLESEGFDPEEENLVKYVSAYGSYSSNSLTSLERLGGEACVGQAEAFAKILQEKGFGAYCCPVRLPERFRQGSPLQYGHIAVVVPYQHPTDHQDRGFVMFDPGLSLPDPILVKPEQPVVLKPWEKDVIGQQWTFTLNNEQNLVYCDFAVSVGEGGGRSEFEITKEWSNPDQSLSKLAVFNRRPRLTNRDSRGNYVNQIAIEKKTSGLVVVVQKDGRREKINIHDHERLDSSITDIAAEQLLPKSSEPRNDLLSMIDFIGRWLPRYQAIAEQGRAVFGAEIPTIMI